MVAAGEGHYISPGCLAVVYARLGDIDLAMDYLNRGVEEYDSWIFNLDPPIRDSIRNELRFIVLCQGLKMACDIQQQGT